MSSKITTFFKKNNISLAVGKHLKALRKANNLTLMTFANNLNVNTTTSQNYEAGNMYPSLKIMIKIANYYGITLDFLLFWDSTLYTHSFKLLSLAEKIEKENQDKRYQIETTTHLFLKGKETELEHKLDSEPIDLTDNFHRNLKTIRKLRLFTQKGIADMLELSRSQVTLYEKRSFPSPDKLFLISRALDISVHALATGKRLDFDFRDQHLKDTMLKADKILSLKDKEVLCRLLEQTMK